VQRHSPARRAALVAIFILSGVGGLSLEVVWTRQLSISIGSSSRATTAVVAIFMAGLALGSAIGARRSRTVRKPVRAYALAELGIALGAALASLLLPRLEELPAGPARYGGAALLMLLPATCMGATWPLLTEAWRRDDVRIAGRLYAANTFGAATGALLTGFVSVGLVGLTRTGLAAAFLDALCGLGALAVGDVGDVGAADAIVSVEPVRQSSIPRWFLALAAAGGFVALAEEILWTRALLPYVNSSTYAFAAILGIYLLGLSTGSWVASRGRIGSAAASRLVGVQLALALTVAATPLVFAFTEEFFQVYAGMRRATSFDAWLETVAGTFFIATVALAPPTFLLGASTPLAIRVATERGLGQAPAAGAYGSANTLGAIAGSVVAGFVLVPRLGTQRGILLCGLLHLALAVAWSGVAGASRVARLAAVAVAAAVAGICAVTPGAPFTGRLAKGFQVLLVDEGPQDTTAVVERGAGGVRHRGLISNGVGYAGDSPDSQRYMALLGHLPALLSDDPSRALVICVGTGTTAAAVALSPAVRELTLVDISPVVERTLPLFAHVNREIWRDPRVRIVQADGRQYLSRADRPYGLITLEPPPPRMAGAGSLYTRELYARARRALVPGGVLAQWLPVHGTMTAEETWMLVRTFLDVFPEGALFVLTPDDAALLGGPAPFHPNVDVLRGRVAEPGIAAALRSLGFDAATPEALAVELLALSPVQGDGLRALAGEGLRVTDDLPLIEQFAVGLARAGASPASRNGRTALFEALARTAPTPLETAGSPPAGLAAALAEAQARYGSAAH
jgi:spermidine synthase